jgi:beta-alanine degradation protein BauB
VAHWRTTAGLVLACGVFTEASSRWQDRAAAVPDMKVLLQNERVRVQFHDVAVGETTPLHSHPAYVAYVFNAYTARSVLADGTEATLARKPGDVFYSGPVTHRIVNTGTTPIHNLIVELKDDPTKK